jgi:putative colanic acid biosynthesis acetyltransferase WcaF
MNQTDLSSFNNSWYKPGNPVKRGLWYVCNILFFTNRWFPFSSAKKGILKLFGAKIGKGVVIKPHVNIKYPWKLRIGDYTWIGEGVWIDNLDMVSIGKNCCLSQGAFLLCGNHDYKKTSFDLILGEITLEDGAWIGAKSIVCPGVRVGSHAVLSVNSVATKDLLPYSVYSGNPATLVRERVLA